MLVELKRSSKFAPAKRYSKLVQGYFGKGFWFKIH
jgi:hypothetical protein